MRGICENDLKIQVDSKIHFNLIYVDKSLRKSLQEKLRKIKEQDALEEDKHCQTMEEDEHCHCSCPEHTFPKGFAGPTLADNPRFQS